MVCQKKTFRVETNIVRCEKYKPKGKTYKLVKQAEKNDRGTSPPPSRRRRRRRKVSQFPLRVLLKVMCKQQQGSEARTRK